MQHFLAAYLIPQRLICCGLDVGKSLYYNITMESMQFYIAKSLKNEDAYYTLNWTPLIKADKYKISTAVPAVSGIYELYKLDDNKQLHLLKLAIAWYGGIRSNLREAIDPEATVDPERRKILEDATLYYRYSCCPHYRDLEDVLWFMHETYFGESEDNPENSGRYETIYLNENSPDNFIWDGNAQ